MYRYNGMAFAPDKEAHICRYILHIDGQLLMFE